MTVRLWVLSDLHLDVCPLDLDPPEHDVAVVAGDVSERLCRHVLPWLADLRARTGKPLVYVPGNHDFWRSTYQTALAEARPLAADAGVSLLVEGEVAVHNGVRFVGATLWTDWALRPDQRARALSDGADRDVGLRDVRRVKWRRGPGSYSAFLPTVSAQLHRQQRRRVEEALAEPHAGPTVVVTHHAPHERSLRGGGWREPLDAAYASDLSSVLEGLYAPDLWVHGHIHECRDYTVGRTRVIANPRGYVTGSSPALPRRTNVENPAFDPSLVVEV